MKRTVEDDERASIRRALAESAEEIRYRIYRRALSAAADAEDHANRAEKSDTAARADAARKRADAERMKHYATTGRYPERPPLNESAP